jgi:hypothetical protein
MRLDILEYGGKWRGFFYGMSIAYLDAHKSQELMLGTIKELVKASQGPEYEEAKLFGLSVLMTLVGGPIADSFARQISPLRQSAEKAVLDKGGVKTDPVDNLLMSKSTDWIVGDWVDSMKGWVKRKPLPAANFVPAGVSPTKYLARLQKGAEERTNVMSDDVRSMADKKGVSELDALKMKQNQRKSRFFTDAPPSTMDGLTEKFLQEKAEFEMFHRQ